VYSVLYGAQHLLSEFADELYWRMCRWPLLLNSELEDVRSRLTRFRTRYMTQLKAEQVALAKDLAELRAEVDKFTTLGDLKQVAAGLGRVDDRTSQVADLHSRLQRMGELAELYQARETIFGLPTTDYPQIELIQKTLDPYATLWQTCGEFMRCLPDWMDGPFTEIDADAMAADVDRWWRGTAKLAKSLEGPPLEVVAQSALCADLTWVSDAPPQLRTKLEDFQGHMPLIAALRNPGLRDRHWARISAAVQFPVKVDAGFSVSRALQLELPKFLAQIEEVSEYASKEYSLERTLDKMQ
ncbi:hypothetical protein QJQ45_018030, partial [Haematococcus lacustris]